MRFFLGLFLLIVPALVQAEALVLEVNTTTPKPGDTLVFSVKPPESANVRLMLLNDTKSMFEQVLQGPDYRLETKLPQHVSGRGVFFAAAIINDQMLVSNQVTVTIQLDMTKLKQLIVDHPRPREGRIYLSPDSLQQLHITGRFSDGVHRDLTSSVTGTMYEERIIDDGETRLGDSDVFSVHPEGRLFGIKPGISRLLISNNGVFTTYPITVGRVTKKDTDGDSVSDEQEAIFGSNSHSWDTDEDGSRDSLEAGLDVNKNGRWDIVEPQIAIIQGSEPPMGISSKKYPLQYVKARPSKWSMYASLPLALKDYHIVGGVVDFALEDIPSGESVEIILFYEQAFEESSAVYLERRNPLKLNPWFDLSDQVLIQEGFVILRLTDNGVGDSDLREGVIKHSGALALKP